MVTTPFVLITSLCLFISKCQETETESESESTTLNHSQIWGFGVLAGFGISSIGFIAALILVIAKKCCNLPHFEIILKFLFSLSCGALIGDAVIHILAEAYAN